MRYDRVIRRSTFSAALLALLVATAGCAGQPAEEPTYTNNEVDGPTYGSLSELMINADAVVTGRFEELVETTTERDLTGDEGFIDDDRGLVLDLWSFTVETALLDSRTTTEERDDLVGQTLVITQIRQPDGDAGPTLDGSFYTATPGANAALFLREYPTTTDGSPVYAVVGLGVGSLIITSSGLEAPQVAQPELSAELERIGTGWSEQLTELAATRTG